MVQPTLKLVTADNAAEGKANCKALGQILERVGDKWTILIVGALATQGVMRFNALQREIPGVSHKVLTTTLRALERDGLVSRTAFATIPPSVDSELTEPGQSPPRPLLTLATSARARQDRKSVVSGTLWEVRVVVS